MAERSTQAFRKNHNITPARRHTAAQTSSLIPYFSWIALMNSPFSSKSAAQAEGLEVEDSSGGS